MNGVRYRSEGRLLIIGSVDGVSEALNGLPSALKAEVLLTEACSHELAKKCLLRGVAYRIQTEPVCLSGYLGAFRLGDRIYDLVLDLQQSPAIKRPVSPLGYCATQNIAEGLAALADLVGEFEKPRYFELNAARCAHSSHHIQGCSACLDVCESGAIRSVDFKIEVNPYLCQGLGDCSAVCPTGALSYVEPPRNNHLDRLKSMREAYAGEALGLLLHAGEIDLPEGFLSYPLESLASCGMDVWLSALAYGFSQVVLLDRGDLSEARLSSLQQQILYAQEIIESLGYDARCIRLAKPDEGFGGRLAMTHSAAFAGVGDKRLAIELALAHLYEHASIRPEFARLSPGAAFGEIAVEASRCTLCMACVSVCPEKALLDGGDSPRLQLIEANCVQCGVCEKACPEKAIALKPCYAFDRQSARTPRLLHESDVFCCIVCAKPFATLKMIESITAKLKNHPMFQGEKMNRLRMCEVCRIKDLSIGERLTP